MLYVGITCGFSAAYVAGQLEYCMDNLDRFIPVVVGFNPVSCARLYFLHLFNCFFGKQTRNVCKFQLFVLRVDNGKGENNLSSLIGQNQMGKTRKL